MIFLFIITCILQIVFEMYKYHGSSRYPSFNYRFIYASTTISNLEEGNTSYWLISGLHWISNFPFTNGRDFQSMGVFSEKISSTKREEGWKYPMIGCYWNYLYLRYLESKMSIKWKDVFRYEISRISCNDVRASFFCRASSLNAHILTQRGHVDFP